MLAKSITTQSVYVRPREIVDRWTTARRLAPILGVQPKKVSALLDPKKPFVWVGRKISNAQASAIRKADLPGVYLDAETSRQYPQGHLAGQLLGFVNVDGKDIEGVEKSFNDLLAPSSTKYRVQKDAAGNRLSSPERGDGAEFDGRMYVIGMRPSGVLVSKLSGGREIGRRRVGKECRSRWSPYH